MSGGGGDLPVRAGLVIPDGELAVLASRSGGPGGQNVNKVSSRVTLRWSVRDSRVLSEAQRQRLLSKLGSRLTREGDLVIHADGTRSQAENRSAARQRLAVLVRAALHVPKARRKTKPTAGSRRRRLAGKRQRAETKHLRRRPPRDE